MTRVTWPACRRGISGNSTPGWSFLTNHWGSWSILSKNPYLDPLSVCTWEMSDDLQAVGADSIDSGRRRSHRLPCPASGLFLQPSDRTCLAISPSFIHNTGGWDVGLSWGQR